MNIRQDHPSFQMLFEALDDAMLLVDQAGIVVLANTAACAFLGYGANELCGLNVEALLPERFREQHPQHRDLYSSNPRRHSMTGNHLVALSRDGREVPVSIGFTPLQAQDHMSVLVTLRIDQRRAAEESLRINEHRLRQAQQATGFGICDADLRDNTVFWDACTREILGVLPDEVITLEKIDAIIHPEDRAHRAALLRQALDPAGDGSLQAEFRILRHSDGAERWISSIGQVSFEAGQPLRLLSIVQDITERMVAQQKLQEQRDSMETLLKLQIATQTAVAIAHEINQPLTAISAYSEVALHSMERLPEDAETMRHALEACMGQAHRAGNTLHELLGFLQKQELVVHPLDINQLVRETITLAKQEGYDSFNPVLQLAPGIPPVLGNTLHVQKVLLNLLHNSMDAIREAGLSMSDIIIKVSTLAEKNMAMVTVQDCGPGLDDLTIQRIFDPFFTTKPHGIGMGLAISRALIEVHGGQLWVDPEASDGATFHFTLPFAS